MCADLVSGADMRLSGRANSDVTVFVLTNLVAYARNWNSENTGRPCAAPMIMDECVEDEFAFDLVDRMTDKVRSDFIQSKSSKVYRRLRRQVLVRLCD